MSKIIAKITADLAPLVNDIECREAFQILEEKEKVFDKLRQTMSIALRDTTDGLNDIIVKMLKLILWKTV